MVRQSPPNPQPQLQSSHRISQDCRRQLSSIREMLRAHRESNHASITQLENSLSSLPDLETLQRQVASMEEMLRVQRETSQAQITQLQNSIFSQPNVAALQSQLSSIQELLRVQQQLSQTYNKTHDNSDAVTQPPIVNITINGHGIDINRMRNLTPATSETSGMEWGFQFFTPNTQTPASAATPSQSTAQPSSPTPLLQNPTPRGKRPSKAQENTRANAQVHTPATNDPCVLVGLCEDLTLISIFIIFCMALLSLLYLSCMFVWGV
ncbi:hypothetical protein GLAREA_09409 [Glarea lozoyensis ATCC 20868]|uniref:Uncharacterized protein n=1 Tax=Glarea lozoyensis (strain ATCC 20868 / MF5171) TaxID=1116229 RepID=S3CTE5_GLAL2|nr:uncharacterized protein GLAREA_09409 [Glarea lozoyensis ATCC 20868]EPE28289.1 hypothetical protein GLAREA_09409 [Glarea lozoyensis ATCC 20868]